MEELAPTLPAGLKLRALIQSRLALAGWERALLPKPHNAPATAAILFTSGSESSPKAVPLSHANILANCRDIAQVAAISSRDRMLAMLPPFHSLGLTVNMVLPLLFGLPVALHPNPTEAALLNALCKRWQPTITVTPPSFLEAMLARANRDELRSLRLGVVGAETCPARIYEAFAAKTGGVLVEGYGVTECAPVISLNPLDAPRPGTIGKPLPSVEVAVVTPDGTPEGTLARVAPGETGILLVRGPNVFSGYLPGQDGEAPANPFVPLAGQSWYRTGDLVRQEADGTLVFAGRLGRFVKLGGEMLSLPQMEQILLNFVAQRHLSDADDKGEASGPPLAVEAIEEDGQPILVLATRLALDLAEANQALRDAGLAPLYRLRRLVRLDALPLLGTGKTDYRGLKERIRKAGLSFP